MWLKTLCVPLFITFICLSTSCFGSYIEDPFHSDVRQTHVYSRPTTYNQQDNVNPINNNEVWSRIDRVTLKVINVDDFGAKANGIDDSQAFKEAWELACNSSQGAIVVVPKNKIYHLKPIDFFGPCNSPLIVKIHGTIKATVHHSDYKAHGRRRWLYFVNVQNLRVEGGGIINGNGRTWWQNSCKINIALPCKEAPTALTFSQCSNLRVAGLRIRNAQQMHLSFNKCVNVKALNLSVIAPGNSPNTDGIHVSETHNIHIKNCVIKTGDDCISVVSGSQNVQATDITCGPGHGISIGSLGARNSAAYVSNVIVNRATISDTTNGVRIKTWQVSAVQVSNVIYENIRGTSASNVALKFNCSRRFPCQEIFLQNVAITSSQEDKEHTAEASCTNIILSYRGNVFPPC
ncbi:hypothetical protein ES332_A08G036100v1 [Gossypium tomentosum]|uniref:Pectate lyase superfamily protein domain-containing protein n=1 Tax=Gossypium tomentosum TaxID=34277 RepID=A0A5D2PB90_GOSTO|nr:hypothetical protein ES332_A08G036100v1 [Gossypium tomentosum]